jgi:hypothetical protein
VRSAKNHAFTSVLQSAELSFMVALNVEESIMPKTVGEILNHGKEAEKIVEPITHIKCRFNVVCPSPSKNRWWCCNKPIEVRLKSCAIFYALYQFANALEQ